MKVGFCYDKTVVEIEWLLPFLPRAGDLISVTDLLTDEQINTLCENRDFFRVSYVSWFPHKNTEESFVEIELELL